MKLALQLGRIRTSHRRRLFSLIRARGMTLLELTVVILVLLALIGVLTIGANAWKHGSDRVLCIMNLQSVQRGVRSFANIHGYAPGETVAGLQGKVIALGSFVEVSPECPGTGTYTSGGDVIPEIGTLYFNCSLSGTAGEHEPMSAEDW